MWTRPSAASIPRGRAPAPTMTTAPRFRVRADPRQMRRRRRREEHQARASGKRRRRRRLPSELDSVPGRRRDRYSTSGSRLFTGEVRSLDGACLLGGKDVGGGADANNLTVPDLGAIPERDLFVGRARSASKARVSNMREAYCSCGRSLAELGYIRNLFSFELLAAREFLPCPSVPPDVRLRPCTLSAYSEHPGKPPALCALPP